MDAPDYRWACHQCGAENEANATTCSSCGFPAVTSAAFIEESIAGPPTKKSPLRSFNPWLFMPEGAIAAVIVVLAPFWFVSLLVHGQILGAAVLGTGVAAFVAGFIAAVRAGSQAASYVAVLGIVVFAWWLDSWVS